MTLPAAAAAGSVALWLAGWAAAALAMTLAWAHQQRTGNANAVDAVWAAGMGVLALGYALAGDGDPARRVLTALGGGLWAARLAGFLYLNRVRGHAEDARYRRLRAAFGAHAATGFFGFYQVQALATALFAVPFLACAQAEAPLAWPAALAAAAVWLAAVGGEALADRQLARWRADPANEGRTCRAGLWAWSRHPNYFCEWLHWWTYPLLALGSAAFWPTLAGPLLMYATLHYATGIPHTERQALARRGADYAAYQRAVPKFFPRPPRRTAEPG